MVKKTSKRTSDSFLFAVGAVGFISTVMTIAGCSLNDIVKTPGIVGVVIKVLLVFAAIVLLFLSSYAFIGIKFKTGVTLNVRGTAIEITCGDIFDADGLRVIGCDTHFDTRADNTVISKTSLHGRLVLEHGNEKDIEKAVYDAAQRLHYSKDKNGQYSFPLGSIVKYESDDAHTYLLLAMTELNEDFESHTNMAEYEKMLMKMWKEIDRVYNGEPIAIPLLGTGMTRFDDGPKDKTTLLRCMLCTLNASAVTIKSPVKIIIQNSSEITNKAIPMYEFKDAMRIVAGRA